MNDEARSSTRYLFHVAVAAFQKKPRDDKCSLFVQPANLFYRRASTATTKINLLFATMKLSTATLGFPRMGPNRELKFALEKHWKGVVDEKELLQVAHDIEGMAWDLQKKAGIERITVGDHYLYDCILAWNEMLGFVPSRYQSIPRGTKRLFAMARGVDGATALSK